MSILKKPQKTRRNCVLFIGHFRETGRYIEHLAKDKGNESLGWEKFALPPNY